MTTLAVAFYIFRKVRDRCMKPTDDTDAAPIMKYSALQNEDDGDTEGGMVEVNPGAVDD